MNHRIMRINNHKLFYIFLLIFSINQSTITPTIIERLFHTKPGHYDRMFGSFNESERLEMLNLAKETFTFAYDNYMKYAFPADELNPIYCLGRGPDVEDPSNININDVLGNYSLTLIDTLDTLVVMKNFTEFHKAVKLVIDTVNFDNNAIVQVFESTIRVIGGLLSAHLLMTDKRLLFGPEIRPSWYNDELVLLAKDLAERLLPAFEQSTTGIPYPRIHLREGVPNSTLCDWCKKETCPAGAGSLLLEFGILSRLTGDSRFEIAAKRAINEIWKLRAKTGLLGNSIDVESTEWLGEISGVGAGIDSFYEYLLKSWIYFDDRNYWEMFKEGYDKIKIYNRRGRAYCNSGSGHHPLYVNVNMHNGRTITNWIDSLSASWPAVQLLAGDVEESICTHMLFFNLWLKFDLLPERYNWHQSEPELLFYPLRPELAESTYQLYKATKNTFYLHVGRKILQSINKYTKTTCGYATVHDVQEKSLEDRMESFFLSETCKYLYLLFDKENPLNKHSNELYLFSTEGHIFPINNDLRNIFQSSLETIDSKSLNSFSSFESKMNKSSMYSTINCDPINIERKYLLPLKNDYFAQLSHMIGVE